jgi:hypothetical protein
MLGATARLGFAAKTKTAGFEFDPTLRGDGIKKY